MQPLNTVWQVNGEFFSLVPLYLLFVYFYFIVFFSLFLLVHITSFSCNGVHLKRLHMQTWHRPGERERNCQIIRTLPHINNNGVSQNILIANGHTASSSCIFFLFWSIVLSWYQRVYLFLCTGLPNPGQRHQSKNGQEAGEITEHKNSSLIHILFIVCNIVCHWGFFLSCLCFTGGQ